MRPTISVTPISRVACAYATWRHGGTTRVTIVAKATFELVHESAATVIDPIPITPGGHEMAPYLPGVGVILEGHARAAGSSPVPSMSVRLAIHGQHALLDKTVHVYGDRAGPAPAQPQPFTAMPLSWDRALRGSGDNPAGRDLPNLLDPANPLRPAGFGAISPEWPSRRRLFGAVDPGRFATPGFDFPARFDWRALHGAPPDQIIASLAGHEWIVLDGVHAALPRVQTQLPGIHGVARWHAVHAGALGPANDLALYSDLLLIDADRLTGSMVWRGSFAMPTPSEEIQVFVGTRGVGAAVEWPTRLPGDPQPLRAPTVAHPAIVVTEPPNIRDSADAWPRPGATLPPDDQAPRSLPFQRPPPIAAPPPPPAVIDDDPVNDSEARRAVIAKLEAGAAFHDDSYPNADLRGLDFSERMMSGCNLTGADLRGVKLTGARLQDAKLTSADLTGADLSRADLSRVDARKANLDGACLDGATITNADFSLSHGKGVHAQKVSGSRLRLAQADWSGAELARANLPDAELSGARMIGTSFAEARLDGCRMNDLKGTSACFENANLSRAHLTGASLVGANFRGATATGAVFDNADLEDADLLKATLRGASLTRARLTRATFESSDMTKTNLRHASGEEPVFLETRLDEADLRQARLSRGTFDRAVMRGVTAVRADFSECRFRSADLSGACLRPARLVGCDLSGANVAKADFRDADLSGANLFDVDRTTAKLAGAKLREVVEREPVSPDAGGTP